MENKASEAFDNIINVDAEALGCHAGEDDTIVRPSRSGGYRAIQHPITAQSYAELSSVTDRIDPNCGSGLGSFGIDKMKSSASNKGGPPKDDTTKFQMPLQSTNPSEAHTETLEDSDTNLSNAQVCFESLASQTTSLPVTARVCQTLKCQRTGSQKSSSFPNVVELCGNKCNNVGNSNNANGSQCESRIVMPVAAQQILSHSSNSSGDSFIASKIIVSGANDATTIFLMGQSGNSGQNGSRESNENLDSERGNSYPSGESPETLVVNNSNDCHISVNRSGGDRSSEADHSCGALYCLFAEYREAAGL